MTEVVDGLAALLAVAGAVFFLGGSLGLLRFPDVYTRLHALTKADNVGLGLLALGVALHLGDPWLAGRLALVWVLVMAAGTVSCHLLAREAHREGRAPWRR
ncbi:multisubunit sodium/proton antiporter, MrpG subunit [Thiohalospira halophila DSM 15071]|uniref:Multisubunit sodium/proton antiporter, MrpG subunit n=1 Tax=Thiohalospira halophila DSM 15071 TaxID=1123397 RepID=A0A1I1NGP2_9GAMM|nr:monovalent cation/H(+) antiporter subunit G [Thiohalospira halophila]SFC93923.1 multisubunit sodium/proton antiporter, MrpG subunit [Thiohalospira halophila DSM 15071]